MNSKRTRNLTRRELIRRAGLATGALALPQWAEGLAGGAPMPLIGGHGAGADDVPLPAGVKAVWDLKLASSERTPTRQRVCLNGLWRWQPARENVESVPTGQWGWFKVPGSWPGITDYIHKDCQTVFFHPDWRNENLGAITAAWYQREITVPSDSSVFALVGPRITLSTDTLNSFAAVYVDGARVGEMRFPAGEVDLTAHCRPGATHLLTLLVTALPLNAVLLSYTDTDAARQVKGEVDRRGLCGDVWLNLLPPGPCASDVKVDPSVSRSTITIDAALERLKPGSSYSLHTLVRRNQQAIHEFTSAPFQAGDLVGGRHIVTESWKPEALWDLNTPENLLSAQVSLIDSDGKSLDVALPVTFGFREFQIQGRDFYLNGTRIFLHVVPIDSASVGAAWASYDGAREAMERLKTFGVNFVYTHNYGCEPGEHLSFTEVLKAADDVGMLVALSQPHFSHYNWKAPDADDHNGYARHAEFYVRVAQNHPSVVAYATSHNACGTIDDTNPDKIDGIQDDRDSWSGSNSHLAMRAQAIIQRFDQSRIVYHHSSGNLGTMHTVNFYVNFTPVQELSDWFEHWATKGVKPVLLCEYGSPISWDWTMYRGWYKGKREWGSAVVPWEYCLAEWNAQFLGDRAYRISDRERVNLRWEADQFRAGRVWHRWDYPTPVGSTAFEETHPVIADYITDNSRAFRTWSVSAFNTWEHSMFWRLRADVDKSRKALPVDWDHLQRPGFSPDYLEDRPDDRVLAFGRADWTPTVAARALIRNNRPLLAYIGGKAARFTSKDHNFHAGDTLQKQIILINNSRATVSIECRWELRKGVKETIVKGNGGSARLGTGARWRLPFEITLPAGLSPGRYELTATARFSTGEVQSDSFAINVLAAPPTAHPTARIALFDPKGETARMLTAMGVRYQTVGSSADLTPHDTLIIGKGALTPDGPGPDIRRVRDGLKVLVMEQTAPVLEQRLGFRVAEYGLRQVHSRIVDHPLLAGLEADHLRDWRGEATTLAPRLQYKIGDRYAPEVKWCGMNETRVWRCGCRGNVASVQIEKPACGDFLPIVDGGYALQYGALLEYGEGKGMVLFCQMDVTGRTETDPAADRLVHNILRYVSTWKPAPRRHALYVGDPAGRAHLEAAGFEISPYSSGQLAADTALIVGSGGGRELADQASAVRDWQHAGGRMLLIGLDEEEANGFLAAPVQMKRTEHIASYFDAPAAGSWLAGVCPADVHNRDPREIPLVTGGATVVGNGVLAYASGPHIVFSQLSPWQFDPTKQMNLKRTFRRVSCLTARLASNMGIPSKTPILERFSSPVEPAGIERRWLEGLYLDTPEEWDDPYRFFGW